MHECKSISWALREGLYVFNLISWNSMGVACGEAFAWVGRSLAKIFVLRYGWEIELSFGQINDVGILLFY